MGGDDVRHRAIQVRHGSRHLIGVVLPQPRRALDVGQKQRHRSPRQRAHAQPPVPGGLSTCRPVSLMLASIGQYAPQNTRL